MRHPIIICAAFVGAVTSGCSGNVDSQSEPGQGGTLAISGGSYGSAVTGGQALGGNGQSGTHNGGQPHSSVGTHAAGASVVVNGGGQRTTGTSTVDAGIGGGGFSGNATAAGRNASGSANGGASEAGRANGGKAAGGRATGGRATGGLSDAGKSAGSGANPGTGSGGKSTGGTSSGVAMGGAAAVAGAAGATNQLLLPEANAAFDYQIGGAYSPPSGVRIVSRDRNGSPAVGLYNICYVNGFQVQPDEESFWTSQHPNLILKDGSGKPVVDVDWGETLLDTSTATKRSELAAVIGGWITQCMSDGFNAVEIDNLDSYSRSNGLLTESNNVAFMALLSNVAHASGLAIAQKNSSELLGSVSTMQTDFAIVEECNRYSECDQYQAAYGNRIFIIEYRQTDFQKGCTMYPELSIVLRDRNVSAPGGSGYVYQGC